MAAHNDSISRMSVDYSDAAALTICRRTSTSENDPSYLGAAAVTVAALFCTQKPYIGCVLPKKIT